MCDIPLGGRSIYSQFLIGQETQFFSFPVGQDIESDCDWIRNNFNRTSGDVKGGQQRYCRNSMSY